MPTVGSGQARTPRPALVGRDEELARLTEIADLAVEHGARLVLISGEAGIGKSSLVDEFLAQLAETGWDRHVGHCIEYADRPLPFGPVVSILRSLLLANLDAVDGLVRHHRDDLAGLLPELSETGTGAGSLAGDVDRLFDAIATTLAEAARRRPMAVLVEDIHWADAATRDLLASLVHSLGPARILVLVTERSGALNRAHPLRTWLAEQRRFPNVDSIVLEGLSRDELTEQATAVLGRPPGSDLVDELLERTGGNPYFSHELLISHLEGGATLPTSLVEFLTSRIERLDDDERHVLRAIAVAGGTVDHAMLAAIVPDLAIGGIVRSLFEASILTVDGSEYAFGHALLREAILRDVLPFEAQELHRRAAEAILSEPRRGTSLGDLASLALHWGEADDPDRSLSAAAEAAAAAAAVAAYETAAEMSLQALAEWPRATAPEASIGQARDQLLLQAAEWLASCYRGAEAVATIHEALESWAAELPDGRRALLLARMAPIEFHLGNPTEAAGLLAEASRMVGDEVSAEAAQIHHRVSKQAVADGQIRPALAAAEQAIQIAGSEGPRVVLVEALTTKALAIGVTEDLDAGIALAREARELALAEGFVSQVANTYRTEMLIFVFREGRTDASLEASRQGLAYAERHCGPRWRAEFRLDLCLGYVEAGRLNDAEPLLGELLSTRLDDLRRLTVLQVVGLHALATGALELADTFLADATEIAERYQSAQETGYQARLLAELDRRRGRVDDALELVDQALKLQLSSDNVTYTRESIVEKIRIVKACRAAGHDDGDDLLADVEELVSEFAGAGPANEALGALMELELTSISGAIDPTAAHQTIEQLESCGFRYEAAQARLLVIDDLIARGHDDRADLEQAVTDLHEIATTHGMTWVAERARAIAKAKRIPIDIPEPEPSGAGSQPGGYPHQLTAREVEVLSLLAEGLTNKAIGERLYVSPRTVGTHVSNLLAKLGLSNRGEAAAAYHRLGLEAILDLREPLDR